MGVTASPGQTLIAVTSHRVYVPSDHLLGDVLPLMLQVIKVILEGVGWRVNCLLIVCSSGLRHFLWDLNLHCKPAYHLTYLMMLQEDPDELDTMRSGVIVLKDVMGSFCRRREDLNGAENLIPVSRSVQMPYDVVLGALVVG